MDATIIRVKAVYEDGALRLSGPVPLRPHQQVDVSIQIGDGFADPFILDGPALGNGFLAPSIEEVRAATAPIAESMADAVIAARQSERF